MQLEEFWVKPGALTHVAHCPYTSFDCLALGHVHGQPQV